jgi:hypothetical protein
VAVIRAPICTLTSGTVPSAAGTKPAASTARRAESSSTSAACGLACCDGSRSKA